MIKAAEPEPGYMKIKSFDINCVLSPLAIPHKTASGTIEAAPLVLLDIETDTGITGSTYVFVYTPMGLQPVASLLADLGNLLAGHEVAPRAVATLVQGKFRLAGNQGFAGMAAAAIDMALWDCLARAAELPLCRLLGASPAATRAYDSMGQMPPQETARQVEASMKAGYRAFKIKAGHPDPAQDKAVLEAMINAAGGEDLWLAADFNQAFMPVISIERARRLEHFELAWLEEPARAEDNAGHAQVRAGTSIPIQTGENWWGIADMQRSLDAGASDHAMPDVMKIGGVTVWLDSAALAHGQAMPVSSHLFTEISAHLMCATPTAHMLEVLDVAGAVLADPVKISGDGTIAPADQPGCGIEWDRQAIAKYSV